MTAVATDLDAGREVVDIEVIDTESHASWRGFLSSPRSRGVADVRLVVSDAHEGLVRAAGEVFPGSSWRRRIAHLERSMAEWCRRRRVGGAAVAALKAVFGEKGPALVRTGYARAVELPAAEGPAAADRLETAAPFALTHLDFPREHSK